MIALGSVLSVLSFALLDQVATVPCSVVREIKRRRVSYLYALSSQNRERCDLVSCAILNTEERANRKPQSRA